MTVKELRDLINNIPKECDDQILFARREDGYCFYPYYLVEAIDYASNSPRFHRAADYDPNQKYFYIDIC